jgi:hypothetical protein
MKLSKALLLAYFLSTFSAYINFVDLITLMMLGEQYIL